MGFLSLGRSSSAFPHHPRQILGFISRPQGDTITSLSPLHPTGFPSKENFNQPGPWGAFQSQAAPHFLSEGPR